MRTTTRLREGRSTSPTRTFSVSTGASSLIFSQAGRLKKDCNFTSTLRQLRVHLNHVDSILPRLPSQINAYLSSITTHELTTLNTVGLIVSYTSPRLTASVVSQLAYDNQLRSAVHTQYDSPSSTSPSSASSSDEASPHPQHSRRVTDPIHKGPLQIRARSQTVAGPDRRLTHPDGRDVDPLTLLDKATEDLRRTTKDVDEAAERVARNQDRVGKEIRDVVDEVDRVEKAIEEAYLQQVLPSLLFHCTLS